MCNVIDLNDLGLSDSQNREVMMAAIALMNERYAREVAELALPEVEEITFDDAVMAVYMEVA